MENLKAQLEALGCPYVQDVDESWIRDLLFKPGETRLRMLHWLFIRFDSRLKDILDPPGSRRGGDIHTKHLLSVASSFGLCDENDIDLILGKGQPAREQAFWDDLVSLVSIAAEGEAHTVGSQQSSLSEQLNRDCQLLHRLTHQVDLDDAFRVKCQLFPPDLMHICEARHPPSAEKHSMDRRTAKRLPRPDDRQLAELREQLMSQLAQQRVELNQLQDKLVDVDMSQDAASCEKLCKTLSVSLRTLGQLADGFIAAFGGESLPWIQPSQPMTTDLGPLCKQVVLSLQHISQLFDNAKASRASFLALSSLSGEKWPTDAGGLGSVHKEAIKTFQQFSEAIQVALKATNP